METRRIGKIYFSRSLVTRELETTAEILKALSFVPVRAEFRMDQNAMEYIGFSPLFEEVEMTQNTPTYRIKVKQEHGKIIEVIPEISTTEYVPTFDWPHGG